MRGIEQDPKALLIVIVMLRAIPRYMEIALGKKTPGALRFQ